MNKIIKLFRFILIGVVGLAANNAFAQGPEDYNDEIELYSNKGFHAGLYLGAYFANNHSASLYDGYGYDGDGNRRDFENSWMNININKIYGGGLQNGTTDLIAEALGVQHEDWKFDESDMPSNMEYKTAFSVGFNGRYSVDGNNGIVINVNAVVLKAAGNFTIVTRPPPGSTQINNSLFTGNISGEEQRLNIQAGYQGMLGKPEGMRFFIEGGLHATLAKFVNNEIQINDLIINLNRDYSDPTSGELLLFNGSQPVALGFGAFAGFGLHFETSSKWNLQIVYNPILDNVRIAYNPKLTFSQSAGIRLYYKLKKEKISNNDY